MKKRILAVFMILSIAFFATSCSDNDDNGVTSSRNTQQEEANKLLVKTFYQRLFGDKDITAIDDYIVENYIQHNPQVADGRASLKTVASQWLAGTPQTTVDFRKILAEGDLVILHVRNPSPDGSTYQAITEFFRVENNKITEHWDVIQDAPATSANTHPMFGNDANTTAARNIIQEDANKKLVVAFYQRLFGDKDTSAIDDYIADNYIQHNPQVADGKAPLKAMATQWIAGTPKSTVDFRKTVSEGNIVALHIKAPTPDGSYQAISEFFRVENNKITEHWDVIQAAPSSSANTHPMF
ncbi:ester cyclase [Chryseobacterium gambrini]|uniref:Ester cyclase n=1 Tax=Chryseobacterium gambrini TaxID=373672 RepID=A0AAJ1VJL1_9FLAO|nr:MULTISPECIES: ester cyclase [Chryseobacterium]MDN4011956.1 ester cyclase [Chryseobacterium gambrini]MDN4029329.1 ester cyclase [Chryseobacterium gambrini]